MENGKIDLNKLLNFLFKLINHKLIIFIKLYKSHHFINI